MERFKKILCPMDFSEFSMRALRYAVAFAEQYNAELLVYHSVPATVAPIVGLTPGVGFGWQPSSLEAEEQLQECIAPFLSPNLEVVTRVDHGYPANQIVEAAAEEKADLIVMGTHGLTGYEAILMGSVTNKVLHKTRIPVLAVCKPTKAILSGDPNEPLLIGKILCAVDPANINLLMLNHAMSLARSNRCSILFFTVSPEESRNKLADLHDLIRPEKEDLCKVEFLESRGYPVEEIANTIREKGIDLAVMGHRSKMTADLEGLGSVTLRVIPKSNCPVLVVRD